jgi:hypothetical protein
MATYYARKAGNIDANDVWATTPSGAAGAVTFASGDVLVANSFAVTVNVTTNLGATGEVRNDTTGGATNGGSFSLSNGITLTANIISGTAASTACATLASTASATVVGNITGGPSGGSSSHGLTHSGTGTLTVTGNVTGGASSTSHGINATSSGAVVITGNVTGGSATFARGVLGGSGPITITGNCVAGSAGESEALRTSSGTTNVTGIATGGGAPGIVVNGSAAVTLTGTAVGGANPGFSVTTSGTGANTVTRAKGGASSTSGVGVAQAGNGVVSVQEVEWGDLGASPTSGAIRFTSNTSNVALIYVPSTAKKTLVDANAGNVMPAASNVRSGVVYNGGNSTGTCAVPAAASVLVGVSVDNTVGTAAVSSEAIQSACNSALTAFSSGRLANVATVASVGQQLADAVTA